MIKLIIPGKPIAKKRPRFVRRGKFVGAYNPQQTEEGRFLWELKQQWRQSPLEKPIILSLHFTMPIPKCSKKKFAETLGRPHIKKPDLDNLVKFVKDCCNGVLWRDDSQVYRLGAIKTYGENPQTRIKIFGENNE